MSQTQTSLLRLENVFVNRNGDEILSDISLDIRKGDFLTLIGPNGAGKSTLIQCIMGLLPISSGQIHSSQSLKISYMPQRLWVNPSVPIKTQEFLNLRIRKDHDLFLQVLDETKTESLLNRPLQSLSGGEFQRVLLARALLLKPQLLVLDEPAQNLDIQSQVAFYKLLGSIFEKKDVSILMVSHDLHLVMNKTKRVICLNKKIICQGGPVQIMKEPEFFDLFGDEASSVMAIYRHKHSQKGNTHG